MKDIIFTPLKRVPVHNGDVLHGLKASDPTFEGFGEVYFSLVDHSCVKGWKKHQRLTLNLMVPVGSVRFVVMEADPVTDNPASMVGDFTVSAEGPYGRLTIPSGLWVAFQGLGTGTNLVSNLIAEEHDPTEAINVPLSSVDFDWRLTS